MGREKAVKNLFLCFFGCAFDRLTDLTEPKVSAIDGCGHFHQRY